MHHTPTGAVLDAPAERRRAPGRQLLALALLCAAQFVLILGITVVNVALPSIQADLGIGLAELSWVVTAYTLAFGGLILLGGRAGDLVGRRRVFLLGLVVFTAASLGAALATSPALLVAARAAQGVGAALLSPSALALVTTTFAQGPLRTRALAVWAAVGASGGGPPGRARAARPPRCPAGDREPGGPQLRARRGGEAGWTATGTLVPLGLAAAGLATFVAVERRVTDPLVPLGVFRRRTTSTALVLLVMGMGPVFSGFYLSSLYLQQVLGHSALRTGVEFLPVAVAIVAAAHVGGGLATAGVVITAMSGAGERDAGLVSGLTSTAHELSIALILPVLATLAAAGAGAPLLGAAHDAAALADGVGTAFTAAAGVALAGSGVALTLLRRGDAAAGAHGHPVH